MDTLTAVLDGHRARGAFVLRAAMRPGWAISVEDDAAAGLLVMLTGEAVIRRHGHEPEMLRPGDVAITTNGLRYVFADNPDRSPTIVIGPGEVSRDLVGHDLCIELSRGVRHWGTAGAAGVAPGTGSPTSPNDAPAEASHVFITATYELASQLTGRLLESVPDLIVVRAEDAAVDFADPSSTVDTADAAHDGEVTGWDGSLVRLLAAEVDRSLPGQDVVIDRLVDLLLVAALRAWFARPDADPPAWWRAQVDPVVGAALTRMHDEPERPWTLDTIAHEVAVSRTTLARRFTALVGQSPMAYLAAWRLSLGAELLRATDATVDQISRQVGYLNPFAFTAAFKRAHGVPPRTFRKHAQRHTSVSGHA